MVVGTLGISLYGYVGVRGSMSECIINNKNCDRNLSAENKELFCVQNITIDTNLSRTWLTVCARCVQTARVRASRQLVRTCIMAITVP